MRPERDGNEEQDELMEEEEEENSDDEPLRPPSDLLQQARDILGRAITRTELMKAWDKSGKQTTVEAKTQATLEKLLLSDVMEDNHVVAEASRAVARWDRLAQVAGPSSQRKNEVIDLGDSDEEAERISKKKGKKRALPREDAAEKQKGKKRQKADVICIDDSDEEQQMLREAMRRSLEPVAAAEREGSSRAEDVRAGASTSNSSSNSSGSDDAVLADNNANRKASTPPTPPVVDEPPSLLAQVLSMVPDVDPDYAENLIQKFKEQPNCVEHVIDNLFSDNTYPRSKPKASSSAMDKGKGRATELEESEAKGKMYMDIKTRANPTPEYCDASFAYLEMEAAFLSVPKPHIRKVQQAHLHFYAPTHKQLTEEVEMDNPPFTWLQNPRKNKGKAAVIHCPEFEEEREWVHRNVEREKAMKAAQEAEEQKEKEEEEAGHVFECGCCFGDYVFSKLVQCPEGHLFCNSCARKNAENAIGNRQTDIQCMDQDGCTISFSASECARFLKPNQILLLEKLVSEKAIDAAGLAGLAKCPYCPWACVIENPDERLLRCDNEECMKVSCLKCQKVDHLPKTCEEYAEDLKTNTIHKVEEAMTEALIRKCPACQQVYIKEYGCNKMVCSNQNCRALSCYICCKKIEGYQHFKGQPLPGGTTNNTSTCILWDHNEGTNEYERIEAARKAAMAEIKATGGEDAKVSEEELAKLAADKPENPGIRYHPGQVAHRQYVAVPAPARPAAPVMPAAGLPPPGHGPPGFNPYVDQLQYNIARIQALQAGAQAANFIYPHPPHPVPARPPPAPRKRQRKRK